MADQFHAFIQNLTVATTGTTHGAAIISLPRSQVEMTDWDMQWQDKITKVVRRVAKDLIANDETEISEVVRRRLFEDIGSDRIRKSVSKRYADWCFERRAQLPPEWTAVDSAATEAKAGSSCAAGSRPAIPSTATLSCSRESGRRSRSTSRRAGRWPCSRSGFPGVPDGFTEARSEPPHPLRLRAAGSAGVPQHCAGADW
jgi:hypothetical protein